MMHTDLIVLNNIQTRVLTWGDPFIGRDKDVIVCITGNPGVPDFYIEFASELHRTTDLPVCVIGHTGHAEVPDDKSNRLKNQEHLFNLQGQLKHKFDLIKLIDKQCKLHLIGHSIGAWMVTEMMQMDNELTERVKTANLLFPTIQRMAETKNGLFLNGILRRLHTFILLFLALVNLLPESTKLFLIGLYCKFHSLPKHHMTRILMYVNPSIIEKVLFLAYDEMDTVKSLNVDALGKMKHFTNIVYGTDDSWAPVHYMDDLKQFQPHLQMSAVDIEHAFVLKSSEKVAEIVTDCILNRKNI